MFSIAFSSLFGQDSAWGISGEPYLRATNIRYPPLSASWHVISEFEALGCPICDPQAMPHDRPNAVYEQYLRVARQLGHYRWFSLLMKHAGSQLDRALIHASRGRLSIGGPAMPTMLLTTKGRKSGKERTVPLYYVRDGKNLVAVCENFGLDTASSWPMNLRADPKARIEIDGTTATYLSRPATDEEAARNMPRLIEMWPAHDTYVKRSGMRKVFIFEPVDAQT